MQLDLTKIQYHRQEQPASPAEIRRRLAMISDIAARGTAHPNDFEAIAALQIISSEMESVSGGVR
jgi:hypothetical protein